jgi:L-threonylcarbamoyladenylate synthase
MSVVFEVEPDRPVGVAEALEAANEAVNAGRLVVFPTETVYGIACRPSDRAATTRLFEAKRRPQGLNLPVLVHSADEALDLVIPNDAARRLARAFWPGPLTLVLPRGERSKDWPLGEAAGSIGIRVPDHLVTLALLRRVGPLAATSANISGMPPASDRVALEAAFGDAVAVYIVERRGEDGSGGRSSTVVDLNGRRLRVVREGPIRAIDVSRVAGESSGARPNSHWVH